MKRVEPLDSPLFLLHLIQLHGSVAAASHKTESLIERDGFGV